MNPFAGKKALCFIALPHHNRFLVPIMEGLQQRGVETVYFTVPAEGGFEITLNHAKLPYRHILDYADDATSTKAGAGYRELRGIFQQKILSNPVLQAVPVVVQDKVIRGAVESFHALERMIECEKPDVLFALHELNPWGKMLGYLSHVHRIPFFTLQEGLYYADVHYYRFHTDFSTACIVWGEDCRQILLRAGCSDDKIFPLGNTHLWAARKEFTDPATVKRTRATLGIAPDKKIILFLMSHSHYQSFDGKIFLDWMKARGDVLAVFKWHPVTSKEIVDRAMARLQGQRNVLSIFGIDTYALIGASEICITVGNSTTGLEALAFGKPLLEVRLPDQEYSFAEHGVAEPASGFENFGPKCAAILDGNRLTEWHSRVENYLAHNFAYRDQHTMKRIMDLVGESLSVHARVREEIVPLPRRDETTFPVSIIVPLDESDLEVVLATIEAISAQTAAQLYEILLVNCSSRPEIRELLTSLDGDVHVIDGEPGWNYAACCNRAASLACGKYLILLKPGSLPQEGWLEGLLSIVEQDESVGIAGGLMLNGNGLIWDMGIAFDVNQAPFSIYRLLHPEFPGAKKQRNFRAVRFPFLVARELFCRLGGLDAELSNRFEDVDFCLRVEQSKLRTVYTPAATFVHHWLSWQAEPDEDQLNRIRFYSKWTGSLWQDDEVYLAQDAINHDVLSGFYRDLAGRMAAGTRHVLENSGIGSEGVSGVNTDTRLLSPS